DQSTVRELRTIRKERLALEKAQAMVARGGAKHLPSPAMPEKPKKLVTTSSPLLPGGDCVVFIDREGVVTGSTGMSKPCRRTTKEGTYIMAGADGAAFDPVSRRVLLAAPGTLALADAETGALLSHFKTTLQWWSRPSFSRDGSIACVASFGGVLGLW